MGYVAHNDVCQLAKENLSGIVTSQPCEESFGYMKNKKVIKGKKRYRRIEKCFGAVVGGKVLEGRSRYKTVTPDTPSASKTSRLPQEAPQYNSWGVGH